MNASSKDAVAGIILAATGIMNAAASSNDAVARIILAEAGIK